MRLGISVLEVTCVVSVLEVACVLVCVLVCMLSLPGLVNVRLLSKNGLLALTGAGATNGLCALVPRGAVVVAAMLADRARACFGVFWFVAAKLLNA